jgi:hypothetical protein
VHTGIAVSDPVTVPNHDPVISIESPADGSNFLEGATIGFSVSAYDPDTGSMPDASLTWSSDLDGAMGTGEQLPFSGLSAGTHTITLTADDGQGGVVSDSVQVAIYPDPSNMPAPPDQLKVQPAGVELGGETPRLTARLVVENQDPLDPISWYAYSSESWLQLSADAGMTPDNVKLSLSGDEPAGSASAVVTFGSQQTQDTIEIQVIWEGGKWLFLPLIVN